MKRICKQGYLKGSHNIVREWFCASIDYFNENYIKIYILSTIEYNNRGSESWSRKARQIIREYGGNVTKYSNWYSSNYMNIKSCFYYI